MTTFVKMPDECNRYCVSSSASNVNARRGKKKDYDSSVDILSKIELSNFMNYVYKKKQTKCLAVGIFTHANGKYKKPTAD